MSGIAGLVDFNDDAKRYSGIYEEMIYKLRRRGPDGNGKYLTERACLLQTKLSATDSVRGKQPMKIQSGEWDTVLVCDGELYNTEELMQELQHLGHNFQERSEEEVLLHAYLEWGIDCVDHFLGVFGFAVWDEKAQELFISRDKLGVKPFFYCCVDGQFVFASEMKALLCHPLIRPEVGRRGVAELMLIGPGRTPGNGVFRQISELKAGHSAVFSRGKGLQLKNYWRVEAKEHPHSFEETLEMVRYLVMDSIRRQSASEAAKCVFLSGGLDSSTIASLSGIKQSFSVDYSENDKYFTANAFQPNSDKVYIDQMVSFLGLKHTNIVVETDELADALFEAVEARDLPGMADVDSSLLLFCRSVKKHADVALSGECADELFGGYPWFRDEKILRQNNFPWSQSTQYRATFTKPELAEGIDAAEYVQQKYDETVWTTELTGLELPEERRMKQMIRLNTDWFMPTLVDRTDRMSMFNGLTVRVPFCDPHIAQYLYNVPWEYKNHLGREKGLLREALTGILPDEVLWRKKSPYPKTHHPAYLKKVSEMLRDILNNPNSPIHEITHRPALEELLSQGDNVTPWYGQLMTAPQTIAYFIQINAWMEKYHVQIVA